LTIGCKLELGRRKLRIEHFVLAVREGGDCEDHVLLIRVVFFRFIDAGVDAECLAVELKLLDEDGYSRWGVTSPEDDLVLHDAEYLLVSDLAHVVGSHEAAGQCRQEVTEAGEELPPGVEVPELHRVDLLGDCGCGGLFGDGGFDHSVSWAGTY